MIAIILLAALAGGGAPNPAQIPGDPGQVAQEAHVLSQFFKLRVAHLERSLGLSEDRARDLAERWGRWDREVIARLRQQHQLREQFLQVLQSPAPEPIRNQRLQPLLDRFLALRRQQEDGKRQFEDQIRVNLSPAQQARLILLMEDLQPKLRELLGEHRSRGGRY